MAPSVPSGKKIWVRSTGPTIAVLEATSTATVPHGNVYLYDGNTGGVSDAQHLILAKTDTLKNHCLRHRRVSRPRLAGGEEDDRR